MTGLMQRIFRRRSSGSSGRGASGLPARLKAGFARLRPGRTRLPWGKRAGQRPLLPTPDGAASAQVVETSAAASFRDRGRMRRRLRYLRRARELAFRDVGGLIFDMRRFGRERPDLVEAKLTALAAVDQELRALERVLDDPRPIHELREPGLSSCQRCGALHASEDNFCPHCGLQFGGPQAMGEVGGAIAAPPQPPPAPVEQPTAPTLVTPGTAAPAQPAPRPEGTAPAQPAPRPEAATPAQAAPRPGAATSAPPAPRPAAPADVPERSADAQQQTQVHRPPDGS